MSAAKSKLGTALGALSGFIGLSAVAGIMIATMMTPAIAMTGLVANSTVSIFDSLPDYLRIDDLAQPSTIMAKQGDTDVVLARVFDQNRIEVTQEEMGETIREAAVAAEDRRFFEHAGVDIVGLFRAVITNLTGGDLSGASTLTMQLVRNHLVQQAEAAGDPEAIADALETKGIDGIMRKAEEIKMATALERRYSKEEILTGYLNIAHFGGQTYGVEAAANRYYGVSAKDLTAVQAASLIAIVQSPNVRKIDNPASVRNGEANGYQLNFERRNYVLNHMLTSGYITEAEYQEGIATPVEPTVTPIPNGCMAATYGQYFCDYVMQILKNDKVFSADAEQNMQMLKRGGYTIYTTLDVDMQAVAEASVRKYAPAALKQANLGSVATSIEVGTGRVLTMGQNKIYDPTAEEGVDVARTAINYSTTKDYGGSIGFQTGSVYKIFTLLEWLNQGNAVNQILDTRLTPGGYPYNKFTVCGAPYGPASSKWRMSNDRNFPGSMTVVQGTINSVNSAFAAMAMKLDICNISDMALKAGLQEGSGKKLPTEPATILGAADVSPLSVANSMATIANGGVMCTPIAIDRIVAPDDSVVEVPKSVCTQAFSAEVAAAAAYTLTQSMNSYSGRPRDGVPLFGKTGTSNDVVQNWLAGSSSKVATAVWVGNVKGHVNLLNIWHNGHRIQQGPQLIFKDVQSAINRKYGGGKFGQIPGNLLNAPLVSVPPLEGMTEELAIETLEALGFTHAKGEDVSWNTPAGTIGTYSPGVGSEVPKGSTITYRLSKGDGEKFPDVSGLTEAQAKQKITDLGFVVDNWDTTQHEYHATVPVSRVTRASIAAGSIVSKHLTTVVLYFSDGPEPVVTTPPPTTPPPTGP
ncbi:MAG: transglycosylase domain-containing protein [Microbacteriaceae bacterium]